MSTACRYRTRRAFFAMITAATSAMANAANASIQSHETEGVAPVKIIGGETASALAAAVIIPALMRSRARLSRTRSDRSEGDGRLHGIATPTSGHLSLRASGHGDSPARSSWRIGPR